MNRGDVYWADLDPIQGSEQEGRRPVVIIQRTDLNNAMRTVVAIPTTSKVKYASLPSCLLVKAPEGGLSQDSVVLCHQIRVLDKTRLKSQLGTFTTSTMAAIEKKIAYTFRM